METKLVICDTNIFIHWFNNDINTINHLYNIGLDNIALSSITAMELYNGIDNKQQLQRLKKYLKNYTIVNFNQAVSTLSLKLIENYKLSYNLQIPDAIIAASSLVFDIPLFTYNLKEFKYIPDIKLYV